MECVVDLSYCAGWFQPSQGHSDRERLLKAHIEGEIRLFCPSLRVYEVLNLLACARRRGTLTDKQADAGLGLLNALHVRLEEPHSDIIHNRVQRFCRQHDLTAYDCAYLELADRLQAPLLTRDKNLLAAARERKLAVNF